MNRDFIPRILALTKPYSLADRILIETIPVHFQSGED